jgi:hypothetical protein
MARKSNNTALNALASGQNSGILDNALEKTVTFAPTTTGATGAFDIATVTGTVALSIIGICTTIMADAVGGGTIEVGTALSTAGLIAQTTTTDIDANEIWHDATPDASIELTSVILKNIVTQDVQYKVTTQNVDSGVITFIIRWTPISTNGNVVIA